MRVELWWMEGGREGSDSHATEPNSGSGGCGGVVGSDLQATFSGVREVTQVRGVTALRFLPVEGLYGSL